MKKIYFDDFEYAIALEQLIVGEKYVIVMKNNQVHVGIYRESQYFDVEFYFDFDDFDLIKYVIKHDEFIEYLDSIK